jgi:hypothetical protein
MKTASAQPAFRAFCVSKREGQNDFWNDIGAAFPHRDGVGYSVVLSALPIDGKIVLRPAKDAREQGEIPSR